MKIQHNIMAMNAYRNLGMNNSKLSKNLEKLSSGFRINRAGDDAAGLAISEKMRAQIAGLDQAQKNAQSGINLVQTAEGALTEVHDMLNRMVTLSTQAADGTYGESERAKIQAEIDALTEEIDRIADNSNFNGTKLLDGSLSSTGATKTTANGVDLSGLSRALTGAIEDVDAVKGKYEMQSAFTGIDPLAEGDTIDVSFTVKDADGNEQVINVQLTAAKDTGGNLKKLVAADGTEYDLNAADKASADDIGKAIKAELEKNELIKGNFKITNTSGKLDFEAKVAGKGQMEITGIEESSTVKATEVTTVNANAMTVATKAENAYQTIDLSKAVLYDGSTSGANTLDKAAFEINGEKFVFVAKGKVNDDTLAAMKEAGITHYVEAGNTTLANTDVAAMVEKIKIATGLDAEAGKTTVTNGVTKFEVSSTATDNVKVALRPNTSTSTKATGGMNLQIGASSVETIKVSVDSMKADALGIAKLSVGSEKLANAAIDTVNAAIEKVSVTRGNLGAIQNRLEHTINNLGVMAENIQDAEANIRDTDIADEMMNYTKNNILIQSAQAMLAQANQVPQGVLQLMQ